MSASKQDYDENSPPVYSSTADSAPLSTSSTHFEPNSSLNTHQHLAFIDFTRYKIGSSTLSDDHATVLTRDERFSRDPHALLQLIHEQAQLPPKLLLRIRGSHSVYGEVKSDFDLTLNLMPLLCSETERWSYLKLDGGGVSLNGEHLPPVPGTASSNLEKLAIKYCDDPSPIKSFSLKRRVVNFDRDCLEGQIRNTIATTRYQGKLKIEFPIAFSEVVVQQGEIKKSLKDIFYWSMQPPAKKDPTKRYESVHVIWPFANVPANERGRRCTVQSEHDWWTGWKDVVRNAVIAKLHGNVTLENRMDVAMGITAPEPAKEWAVSK